MRGVKHDNGKPEPRLVLGSMARAILAVSEVASYGAKKYSPDNWLLVDDAMERYTDAGDRHRLMSSHHDNDDESGLLQLAHAAWNALAVLELKLRDIDMAAALTMLRDNAKEVEDRWAKGEERINNIGANGNDGLHYDVTEAIEPCMDLSGVKLESWAKFVATNADGERAQFSVKPAITKRSNWSVSLLGEVSWRVIDFIKPPTNAAETLIKIEGRE